MTNPVHIDALRIGRLRRERALPTTTAEYRATQKEKPFQDSVIEEARASGWRVFHHADSRKDVGGGVLVGDADAAGFPDMVAVRGGRIVVVEFKRGGKEPRQNQRDWLAAWTGAGAEAYVWTPVDSDEATKVLR